MADKVKLPVELQIENWPQIEERIEKLIKQSGKKLSPSQNSALKEARTYKDAAEGAMRAGNIDAAQENFTKAIKKIEKVITGLSTLSPELEKALEDAEGAIDSLQERAKKIKKTIREADSRLSDNGKDLSNKAIRERVKAMDIPYNKGSGTITIEKELKEGLTGIEAYRAFIQRMNDLLKELKEKAANKTITLREGQTLEALEKHKSGKNLALTDTKYNSYVAEEQAKRAAAQKELDELEPQIEEANVKLQEITAQAGQFESADVHELRVDLITAKQTANQDEASPDLLKGVTQDKVKVADSLNAVIRQQDQGVSKVVKTFFNYNLVLSGVKRLWNDAIHTIKELDKQLTDQALVSGKTRKEVWALKETYAELAAATGFSTTEIANVATQYFRQGKTVEETLTLTRAAAKSAKVAGIDAKQAVDYLTTAINGFGLAAEDAMSVSDKFAALAASSATSYEELAIALSKVASQANLAGMSMDYTLGLLAKGIETTRESAESIGTALKTVIARMRELTDYGETLEDSIDVNNVETQLAYVNIALRDQQGALRSTEDVLDELGRKWDTLNETQQAAIAKALAGTRQQSRLIAILNDYDRTLQLVETSTNSLGATNLQETTYLTGMEAALNKLKVAYETFITSLTNNEMIMKGIDLITSAVEKITTFFKNPFGGTSVLIPILTSIAVMLLPKILDSITNIRDKAADMLNPLTGAVDRFKQMRNEAKKVKEETKKLVQEARKETGNNKLGVLGTAKYYNKQYNLAQGRADSARAKADSYDIGVITRYKDIQESITESHNKDKKVVDELNRLEKERVNDLIKEANNHSEVSSALQEQLPRLNELNQKEQLTNEELEEKKKLEESIVALLAEEANEANKIANEEQKSANALKTKRDKANAAVSQGISKGMNIATSFIAGAGIVWSQIEEAINLPAKRAGEAIEKMNEKNARIYQNTKAINTLKSASAALDELDTHIIKTAEDLEKEEEYRQQLVQTIGEEAEGIKNTEVLRQMAAEKEQELNKDNQKQLKELKDILSKTSSIGAGQWFGNITANTAAGAAAGTMIYAGWGTLAGAIAGTLTGIGVSIAQEIEANDNRKKIKEMLKSDEGVTNIKQLLGYVLDTSEYVSDAEKEIAQGMKDIYSAMISMFDADDLKQLLLEEGGSIDDWANKFKQATALHQSALEALTSSESNYTEKTKAAIELSEAYTKSGLPEEFVNNFNQLYGDLIILGKTLGSATEQMDKFNWTLEQMQDFVNLMVAKYGLTAQELEDLINTIGNSINGDVESSVEAVAAATEKYGEDAMIAAGKLITAGRSLQTIGDDMTKLASTVNNIRETQSKWNSLSAAEQTSFLTENQGLFMTNGQFDEDKYMRFISGGNIDDLLADYKTSKQQELEDAVKDIIIGNETKIMGYRKQLLDEELDEEKRAEIENQIASLESQNKMLTTYYTETIPHLFDLSLDMIVEKQKKQADAMRELYQKEEEQLTESLNKRKEAYQKYFDSINTGIELEKYEEQRDQLIESIAKLSGGTDANSRNKINELRKSLNQLEQQQMETRRKDAQQAVLQSIDTQLSEIQEAFDKLTDSNVALLSAINDNTKSQYMAMMAANGATQQEIDQWLRDNAYLFDNTGLPTAITPTGTSISTENTNTTMNFQINGQSVNVGQQDYNALMNLLKQICAKSGMSFSN